ncbi:MAG: phosphodiester glycosidase family protein [Oscillospiraceae bacterium]
MKNYLWAGCFGLALTAFTAYISLDTFVFSTAYQTNTNQSNTSMFASLQENTETLQNNTTEDTTDNSTSPTVQSDTDIQTQSVQQRGKRPHHKKDADNNDTDSSDSEVNNYSVEPSETVVPDSSESTNQDDNISITMTEYYEYNTKIYVADVQLRSAEYLKTAFAEDTYGKNVTAKTSSIASANNAILAINGDYYGARERGYVIRNGIVYRNTASNDDLLCIYADGSMKVMNQSDYTADELVNQGVWQAFCFGPGLVQDGSITVSENDEVGKAMASNPRTAIGMISENHYLFVVSDGRTSESAGLSLYQLAEFMKSLGVTTAYNLDGGGSSTMYYNGQVVNHPTTNGSIKERGVSDIVYIG